MLSYLQVTSEGDVSRLVDRLPGLSRAAREFVRKMANHSADPSQLEELAAAFRGNFMSSQPHHTWDRGLWNHSLDVAQTAQTLARRSSSQVDPAQAFLAGLLHDIGRLAFSNMPAAFIERFHRLTGGGCPPVEVEMCLAGRCHGEVGSKILAQWKLPAATVHAVRWHHLPERSPLALTALLYLAEFMTDSQEDLPSHIRINKACRQVGLSMASLSELRRQDSCQLESLRCAD